MAKRHHSHPHLHCSSLGLCRFQSPRPHHGPSSPTRRGERIHHRPDRPDRRPQTPTGQKRTLPTRQLRDLRRPQDHPNRRHHASSQRPHHRLRHRPSLGPAPAHPARGSHRPPGQTDPRLPDSRDSPGPRPAKSADPALRTPDGSGRAQVGPAIGRRRPPTRPARPPPRPRRRRRLPHGPAGDRRLQGSGPQPPERGIRGKPGNCRRRHTSDLPPHRPLLAAEGHIRRSRDARVRHRRPPVPERPARPPHGPCSSHSDGYGPFEGRLRGPDRYRPLPDPLRPRTRPLLRLRPLGNRHRRHPHPGPSLARQANRNNQGNPSTRN